MDQLVLDLFPDDAGHLVAVELDDRICDLDLRHGAAIPLEHFQEKPALAKAGVESGFPSENATMQKC
jgi:hypothetical protein